MSNNIYGERYYDWFLEGSLRSARTYLGALFSLWSPSSVVDIGCGRGAWLSVCADHGVRRLVGLDGDWMSQDKMLRSAIEFRSTDLDNVIPLVGTFDLALSLEVAEHLRPESSERLVQALAQHSGAIIFSAAFTAQPGDNHINTRLHSYWADLFLAQGYRLFDFFRPRFWSDSQVDPWYRQNTFLYVRPEHELFRALIAAGNAPAAGAWFVDAIHPWLYFLMLDENGKLRKELAERHKAGEDNAPH